MPDLFSAPFANNLNVTPWFVATAEELVKDLNRIEGAQDVRFQRYGFELD